VYCGGMGVASCKIASHSRRFPANTVGDGPCKGETDIIWRGSEREYQSRIRGKRMNEGGREEGGREQGGPGEEGGRERRKEEE